MSPAILFDKSNTVLRMGSGIATYGRNLAVAAEQCGFAAQTLLSTDVAIDPRNPVLAEIQLFDVRHKAVLPWLDGVRVGVAGAVRAPFGFRPTWLPQAGVVSRAPDAEPVATGGTYVETRLFESARAYFYIYGRLANVRLPASPALFHATHPLPVRVAGCPNVVTIHDLVPLRLPQMTLDNKRYFFRLIQGIVAKADHIITVSEHSRRDIISLFNVPESRISNTYQAVTIPPGALARSDADVADEITNLFELEPGGYYLFVGALEPKKNISRMIDAYAASGSRRPLVVAGGAGWQNDGDMDRINDPRFSTYRIREATISKVRRVRRIPYLPAGQLATLMRGARALLFPSLFEGFGLPVLEAMTLGTPVLTSNVTSLPEIAGDAALLVDPFDVTAMAAAIRRMDNDTSLLSELSSRGREQARLYSMANYVARLSGVYRGILGRLPGDAARGEDHNGLGRSGAAPQTATTCGPVVPWPLLRRDPEGKPPHDPVAAPRRHHVGEP